MSSATEPSAHAIAEAPREWRCFHCDEVFTDREAAADHFGVQIDGLADDCACRLNATDGLILKMLREAQQELRRYHEVDTSMIREVYALGAEHHGVAQREEEKGYARGLRDGKYETDRAEAADRTIATLTERVKVLEGHLQEAMDAAEFWRTLYAKRNDAVPEPHPEYQRLIDRWRAALSAQPQPKEG